jgi:DNA primase catalytic subunit
MKDQSMNESRLLGLIEGVWRKQTFHLLRVVCITASLISAMKSPISDIIESVITKDRKHRTLKFTNIENLLISATYPTERAATFNIFYVTCEVISSLTVDFSYDLLSLVCIPVYLPQCFVLCGRGFQFSARTEQPMCSADKRNAHLLTVRLDWQL